MWSAQQLLATTVHMSPSQLCQLRLDTPIPCVALRQSLTMSDRPLLCNDTVTLRNCAWYSS